MLGSLAALGVVCTACAFVVFLALIRAAGTSRAMVFTYINPAVAVVAGVTVLSEPFTITIAASFALIIAGSVLATWTQRGPEPPDQEALDREALDREVLVQETPAVGAATEGAVAEEAEALGTSSATKTPSAAAPVHRANRIR